MSCDFLDDDYTINFYNSAKGDYKATRVTTTTSQSVTTQSVTQSVFSNCTWLNATGSNYSEWQILSGTIDIVKLNTANSDNSISNGSAIGSRIEIRGNEIYTNFFRNAHGEENNGIAIYKSGSTGWDLNDYIYVPTGSYGNVTTREFSLDDDHLICSSVNHSDKNKLFIFKSGSANGWQQEQILTTASYNAGSAVDDSDGRYAFMTAKIKNNKIFANGFYSGNYNRFVAFFNSSSVGGWQFEQEVQTGDASTHNGALLDTNGSIGISGVSIDFDGTTAVIGSKQNNPNWQHATGKLHIFTSGAVGGWTQERVDLQSLGLTDNVTVSHNVPSPYGDQEYRSWTRFAYKSCAVSGSYIAASAQADELYNSADTNYYRRKQSVFILKSGSANGWRIEHRIDDPATNLILSSANQNGTSDSEFGTGVAFGKNSIVVNSGAWGTDWSTIKAGRRQGRSYVYVSGSDTGWTLDQTIENPFSGSVFNAAGTAGLNMNMTNFADSWPQAGSVGYGAKPAVSGCIAAINAPTFHSFPDVNGVSQVSGVNYSYMYGAVVVVNGSSSYVDKVTQVEHTQSVVTKQTVEVDSDSIPMKLGLFKGAPNLRGQTADNAYYVEKSNTTLKE
tara:strand:- start:2975 stop:4822 length:1848 start_codon:yes stop_codon:yes gene_type:complete